MRHNTRRKPTRAQLKQQKVQRELNLNKIDVEYRSWVAANQAEARARATEIFGEAPIEGFTEDQLDHARHTLEIERDLAYEAEPLPPQAI